MSWTYRVIRHAIKGSTECWFSIHEVYTNQIGASWTETPAIPDGETLDDLRLTLERMLDATRKPVLEYEEA